MRLLLLLAGTTALAAPVVRWSEIPLSFEPNAGQAATEVRFLARGSSYSVYLTEGTLVLAGKNHSPLRTRLAGANPAARFSAEAPLTSTSNYFVGNDPGQWRTAVPNFGRVRLSGVYPGIDLLYYGKDGNLEYDWIVAPGADPRAIRMVFEGAGRLRIDSSGDLVVQTGANEYRHQRPRIYQEAGGTRVAVAGQWILHGKEGRFRIGAYDPSKELIIDPPLLYSTYQGGAGLDYAYALAVDSAGNTYVTGGTGSANFPTTGPLQGSLSGTEDVFVTKFTPDGSSRLYSTYLGGGSVDEGRGIAVDSRGYAYVTGSAGSLDFPLKNPIQAATGGSGDAFLAKLSPTGSALVYSTYLGGNATDSASAIAVDSAGSAYIVGSTFSTNFPVVAPFQSAKGAQQDAFVAKINPAGTAWVYATYLGGNAVDQGNAIAIDGAGNAYVTGYTASTNFPVQSPFQAANAGSVNAFVTKINPAGSALVYSTYLGGTASDFGSAIAVDSSANVYVTGDVTSKDFPTVQPIEPNLHSTGVADLFVAKFNPSGSALLYSTYLGGGSGDEPYALALDASNNVWITGRTNSSDFPLVQPIQSTRTAFDMFVTEISASGSSIAFSTFIGGSGSESGRGIAVDSLGNIHIAGEGTSTDFPTVKAVQTANGSASNPQDAFVLLLGNTPPPNAPVINQVSDNLVDGGPVVPGAWLYVKGTNLADVQRIWDTPDFNGSTLPTNLNGVEVWINGVPAPVYAISPGQVNAETPANASGTISVQVVRLGLASNTLVAPVATVAPSIFYYYVNGKKYPDALFTDYSLLGDPAVVPGTHKAKPGDILQLYTAGLAVSTSGTLLNQAVPVSGVGVQIGGVDASVLAAALVAPGQFQVNFTVPQLPPGEYPITVSSSGKISPSDINFEMGP